MNQNTSRYSWHYPLNHRLTATLFISFSLVFQWSKQPMFNERFLSNVTVPTSKKLSNNLSRLETSSVCCQHYYVSFYVNLTRSLPKKGYLPYDKPKDDGLLIWVSDRIYNYKLPYFLSVSKTSVSLIVVTRYWRSHTKFDFFIFI